jgi:hypothetical protein
LWIEKGIDGGGKGGGNLTSILVDEASSASLLAERGSRDIACQPLPDYKLTIEESFL